MKKFEIIRKLEEMNRNEDLTIYETDNKICVTIEDFGGFDENFEEIDRELTINPDEVIEFLVQNSIHYMDKFYKIFTFEDCTVELGFGSFEI